LKINLEEYTIALEENSKIGDLIADLAEAEIKEEYRMTIQLDDFKDYGQQILENLKEFVANVDGWEIAPKNYQGVRVNCGANDWFLLRMSLHDPVLVLNVECDQEESLSQILNKLKGFLSNYDKVEVNYEV